VSEALPLMANGDGLHKHAFWLYGVIVGLAVKEALVSTVPDILTPTEPKWESIIDFSRLVVFVFFITRFYLGSAYFFEESILVRTPPTTQKRTIF